MIYRTAPSGHKYLTKLPEASVSRVVTKLGAELLTLKRGKKKWTTGNIEPRNSLPLLIYSPFSDRYWHRRLQRDHHLSYYRKYIRDGNLYILWDDIWKERVREEQEKIGMPYSMYNRLRDLTLLSEYLSKLPDQTERETKQQSITFQINQIKQHYGKNEVF